MKPLITKEQMLKRIDAEMVRVRARKQKSLNEALKDLARAKAKRERTEWEEQRVERATTDLKAAQTGYSALPGLPYKPRKGVFEGTASYGGNWGNYRSSVATLSHDFDYLTGTAHSYEWYQMGAVIKGQYVVNSYYYSSTTAGHVSDLRTTLEILGIKFVEVDAPKGLQNLDRALEYTLECLGRVVVSEKYARIKNAVSYRRDLKDFEKQFATLAKLGKRVTAKMRTDAVLSAEQDRNNRLAEEKQDRLRAKFQNYTRAVKSQDLREIVKLTASLEKLGKIEEATAYAQRAGAFQTAQAA